MNNPMMMGNPVLQLLSMARQGGNPQALIQNMAMRDPRAQQVNQILGGKSSAQQRTIAENMARERGMDLSQLAQSLGVRLPKQ